MLAIVADALHEIFAQELRLLSGYLLSYHWLVKPLFVGDAGFTREQVGRIDVTEYLTYVAVERNIADEVVRRLDGGRVKGREVKVRRL